MALTRPEAAALALYAQGGATTTVHTEDVAMEAARIAPGMFSWERYEDRIDKELVRVALSDARLKKGYVLGSHQEGWLLTPSGLAFAEAAAPAAGASPAQHRRSKAGQASQRERMRLLTSEAYEAFVSGGLDAITSDQADSFFRLNVYVRGQARERKIVRVQNEFGADPELGELVTALASKAKERL